MKRIFQSTSPVWRTTLPTPWKPLSIDISIHVPRVEDDVKRGGAPAKRTISIHVPRVEDDRWFG